MAETTIASGSKVEVWDANFLTEYVRDNRFNPYMGNFRRDALMPILIKTELTTRAGQLINIPLFTRMTGKGKRARGRLTGNEEALSNYNTQVGIHYNRNAFTVTMPEEKFTEIDVRDAGKMLLKTWAAESLRDDIITAAMAYDFTARVNGLPYNDEDENGITPLEAYADYSEGTKDAFLAANTDRFLFGAAIANHSANDHSAALGNVDTTSDRMSADIVRLAKERAKEADPHIRPFKTNDAKGEEWYVLFVGTRGFRDLSADSEIQAANKDARTRGMDNPIFTAGDLQFDGVIIREVPELPVLAGVGNGSSDVGFAALCGAQALGVAWGMKPKSSIKKEDDYGFEWGTAITEARGVAKLGWNGIQHGMVSVFYSAPASA